MPNNDDPPEQKTASKKVFDVAPPGKSPAAPTSKPVIVGHGPMAGDPMMADPDTKLDTEGTPKTGVPISVLTKKLKIEPIHPDLVPNTPDEQPAEAMPMPTTSPEVSSDVSSQPTDIPAKPATEPSAPNEFTSPVAPITDAPSVAPEAPAATPSTEAAPEPSASPQTAEVAAATPPTQKEQDKAAEKAAAEVAEKLAGYEKVIDSKQYFVPVNSVRRKRSMQLLVVGAVLVIVAALVCINFMLDAGTLTLPFNAPHTHLIKQ